MPPCHSVPKWAFPHPRHPIFGEGKLMDGVLRYKPIGKNRIIYCLNPNFPKKNFRVNGHNEIEVGKCWFGFYDMARDGAHGVTAGGISGNSTSGCYSIVINGGAGKLCWDTIDTVLYCDAGAAKNRDPSKVTETPGYKALSASLRTGNPVRVIRGPDGPYAPGNFRPMRYFRYDGLYRVVGSRMRLNGLGGLYELFEFQRLSGQAEIDRSAPSVALCQKFDEVKEGYRMNRPSERPPAPVGPVPAFYR